MSESNIPLWGRAWKLTVKYATGTDTNSSLPVPFEGGGASTAQAEIVSQSSWDPEALRITFDVLESTLPSPFWFADIAIYNLNDPEIQNLLLNATWATLEAGFQSGPTKSSIIWDGPVLQTLFDRENVVDFKITLHCIASIPLINNNVIAFAQGEFSSQAQLVSRMVSEIGGDFSVNMSDKARELLSAKQYPRGKTCFGKVSRYLFDMADDNFLSRWMDGKKLNMTEMYSEKEAASDNLLTFSPKPPPGYLPSGALTNETQSIVGVPRQTPFGVIFRVLLDPRLIVRVPPMIAKLNRAVISQTKVTYGSVQTPLSPSLKFVVAQVRHYGDSRGHDWYTEVTGYTPTYAENLLFGIALPNAPGAIR